MAATNPTLIQMGALGRQTPMSVGAVEYLHGFADGELGVVETIGETSQMGARRAKVGELPGGWYPGKYITQTVQGTQAVASAAPWVIGGIAALVIGIIAYKALK